ncbi:cell wall-binding repeat-containing protein [Clostridioides difficile]|uniref:cell wall-binding repeat-containing protein n=1 Tax=Clostridioides difficile TaxID=1496 RepID=UPI000944F19B|nr:cell wall-binding repeat-containing protein [Clostridioides difficile]EJX3464915.1 cell wall-binding repeat-containing protein [Clostridioides difficile]MBY2508747.1 cell wall-binding repeat-containing protein [Clostridioides difficile]MDM9773665.1 cell wall-binding repeat-containing protein [Clostridioides difficile]MDO0132357.1 cell wall-binding repeat-containing protein [Clostridioides difficile]HBF7477356.1 cell wall-binding repeat-containing protein [Clostridioides difficile]
MKFKRKILTLGIIASVVMSSTLLVSAQELKFRSPAHRIQGANKYETAGLIADRRKYTQAIIINTDKSLADGLSASGLAGASNSPILLTKQNSIPNSTLKRLDKFKKIYLIGGTNSISKNVENILKNKKIKVIRIEGKDRIDTSYNVAKEISNLKKVDEVYFTNAYQGEADSISISPVAVKHKNPVILTNGKNIPFKVDGVKTYAIGGTASINDSLVNSTKATRVGGVDRLDTNEKIIKQFYKDDLKHLNQICIVSSDNLVEALLSSTIQKEYPVFLVNETNDKSLVTDANFPIIIGDIKNEILDQCITPDYMLINNTKRSDISKALNAIYKAKSNAHEYCYAYNYGDSRYKKAENIDFPHYEFQIISVKNVKQDESSTDSSNTYTDKEDSIKTVGTLIVNSETLEVYEYSFDTQKLTKI